MRKGGGKQKGAQFERDCCRMLSLWVTHGVQEDCFWRSAMSGGRSTVAHSKGKVLGAHAGDITCTDPKGAKFASLFLAECKFYHKLNLEAAFTGTGRLVEFWNKLRNDAVLYKKHPILFAKQNRMPIFVCLDWKGMKELVLGQGMMISFPAHDLLIIKAETFFSVCNPP